MKRSLNKKLSSLWLYNVSRYRFPLFSIHIFFILAHVEEDLWSNPRKYPWSSNLHIICNPDCIYLYNKNDIKYGIFLIHDFACSKSQSKSSKFVATTTLQSHCKDATICNSFIACLLKNRQFSDELIVVYSFNLQIYNVKWYKKYSKHQLHIVWLCTFWYEMQVFDIFRIVEDTRMQM